MIKVADHGITLLALMWTGAAISILLVGLRAAVASRKAGGWRWDFIYVAIALVFQLATSGLLSVAVTWGLGQHLEQIPADSPTVWYDCIRNVIKYLYLGLLMILPGFAFSKFSIVALFMDAIGPHSKKSRMALWVIVALVIASNVVQFFVSMFQCKPVEKLWSLDPNVKCHRHAAVQTSYMNAAVSGVTDIALALFPISIVWHLQMSLKSKIAFCCLMGVGVLSSAASFVRMEMNTHLDMPEDPTWHAGLFVIWAEVEAYALIILPSIPTLRPLWLRVFDGVSSNLSKGQSQVRSYSASRSPPSARDVPEYSEEKPMTWGHTMELKEHNRSDNDVSERDVEAVQGQRDIVVARTFYVE